MPLRNVPICLGHLFHHAGKHGTLNADLRFLMGFMMVKVRQTMMQGHAFVQQKMSLLKQPCKIWRWDLTFIACLINDRNFLLLRKQAHK